MQKTYALIEYGTEIILHKSTSARELIHERDIITAQTKCRVYVCTWLGGITLKNREAQAEDLFV